MGYVYASEATCVAQSFLAKLNEIIIYPLIMLLMAVALLMFLWGGFNFLRKAENSNDRETGKRHMIYGVLGLLVMTSAYAILSIAANTFGLGVPDC